MQLCENVLTRRFLYAVRVVSKESRRLVLPQFSFFFFFFFFLSLSVAFSRIHGADTALHAAL
jgi:hypothetical protein